MRQASCSCGQLNLTCDGEPARISMCHCLACQKRTGSVFGVQARYPRDEVTTQGESKLYTRVGDSGGKIDFHFCPECGATVYWEMRGMPGFVAVPVGAFADPQFAPPKVSVYGSRRHPWATVSPDVVLEHLD
jgi:hypothetical protein